MKWTRLANPAFLAALALLASGAIALSSVVSVLKIQLRKLPIEAPDGIVLSTLPGAIPGWTRYGPEKPPMSVEMLETLGTENYVSRDYARTDTPEGERPMVMELHCAYYTGSIDTVPHVPDRCFVGGGMSIVGNARQISIPLDLTRFVRDSGLDPALHGDNPIYIAQASRTSVRPNARVHLPRGLENLKMRVQEFAAPGGQRLFAGYFFIANGGAVASAEDVRLLAFKLDDTYSYYLKVQFTSASVTSAEELARQAGDFLNEMLPEIMLRAPDWVDVREGRYPDNASASSTH